MNRWYSALSSFDPTEGEIVLAPEKGEPGYWSGCAGVLHDGERFWLTYRQRHPRGVAPERGWRCAVATSTDGLTFTDVWSVHKDELSASSMERFSLIQGIDGSYQLFISYVDPADNRWRIDQISADHPERFDISTARPVLTPVTTGTEGVKDPYVMRVGPVTYLFASYAAPLAGPVGSDPHATADIYNVGATTHPTGLATSLDGHNFTWHGEVLGVGTGWDRFQARLNSVVQVAHGWIGFYDGAASHHENYEERCGIAVSADLFNWQRISTNGPWVTSPYRTGSVRYLDAHLRDGQWWLYYEMTREDGAHELRVLRRS